MGCDTLSCNFTWPEIEQSSEAACPRADRWKYGMKSLPATLAPQADGARNRYAAADITYLEGALDHDESQGTAFDILDKSCAAMLQGPDRLRRGLAYAAYDRRFVAAGHLMAIVDDCGHDVACIFPSETARPFLFHAPPHR
jgi:hypothetical protein